MRITEARAENELRSWLHGQMFDDGRWNRFLANKRSVDAAMYESARKRLGLKLCKNTVTLSSKKQDWLTPPHILDLIRKLGPIALDPCGNPFSFVRAWFSYFEGTSFDGLKMPWSIIPQGTVCFANPPYGRAISRWAQKMAEEAAAFRRVDAELVALIPARVGTTYWNNFLWSSVDSICFWNGGGIHPTRIRFHSDDAAAKYGATFDAALLYFGNNAKRFNKIFRPYGACQQMRKVLS